MTSHEIVPLTHFTSDGRELQHVYCLVEHRGVVGDIDKHGDLSLSDSLPFPDEVVLEESGQLALSEWYNMLLSSPAGENTRYLCVWGIGKEREERGRREMRDLLFWLCLMASMHFPKVRSELLMLPASLIRIPLAPVSFDLSAPARSTMEILQ